MTQKVDPNVWLAQTMELWPKCCAGDEMRHEEDMKIMLEHLAGCPACPDEGLPLLAFFVGVVIGRCKSPEHVQRVLSTIDGLGVL